jgi:diguanylate cyclase (GGDEF)-like protein/PAS domain S-box-containing protein
MRWINQGRRSVDSSDRGPLELPVSNQDHGAGLLDPLFYKRLLDHLNDGVYFVDSDRRITYWNEGAQRLTGYSPEEAVGRRCHDDFLCHVNREGERLCTNGCPLSATIADGETRDAIVFLRHKDGHRVPVRVRVAPIADASGVIGAVEIFNDDSEREATRRRAQQFEQMAFLDPLTRVANRRYLEIRLQALLKEFALAEDPFGVLLIDVDKFKQVNDKYGHEAGDQALVTVARTLKAVLRPDDVVGRWGGDEFLAIANHASRDNLKLVADRCRLLVSQSTFTCACNSLGVSISVGGAVTRTGDTAESLLQRADKMMYESKMQGRDRATVE